MFDFVHLLDTAHVVDTHHHYHQGHGCSPTSFFTTFLWDDMKQEYVDAENEAAFPVAVFGPKCLHAYAMSENPTAMVKVVDQDTQNTIWQGTAEETRCSLPNMNPLWNDFGMKTFSHPRLYDIYQSDPSADNAMRYHHTVCFGSKQMIGETEANLYEVNSSTEEQYHLPEDMKEDVYKIEHTDGRHYINKGDTVYFKDTPTQQNPNPKYRLAEVTNTADIVQTQSILVQPRTYNSTVMAAKNVMRMISPHHGAEERERAGEYGVHFTFSSNIGTHIF
jgi:hypothetical protein